MTDDERDNALIDSTAREMTGATPEEGFARRVAARIADYESDRRVRRSARAWLWVPAAACVLLLAALAALLVRPRPDAAPATRPGLDAAREAQPARSATERLPETGTARVSPTTRATRASRPAVGPVRGLPAVTPLAGDQDLPPLTTAPISVTALEIDPLVAAMPLEISAIAIDRIEIAAMP